jgi:WD40 repeat protein
MLASYERDDPESTIIRLTADGKLYFVGYPGGIDIYDAGSVQLLRHLDNIPLVGSFFGFSPMELQVSGDGSRFMVRAGREKIVVYRQDGEEIYTYTFPAEFAKYFQGTAGLSPDGNWLAVDVCSYCDGESDYKGPQIFQVIDINTQAVVYERGKTPGGEARGKNPLFSPDGRLMATTMTGGQTILWDTTTWRRITDFPGTASFSPDSQLLALVKTDTVTIWRWADRKQLRQFTVCANPDAEPRALFSADNAYIAVLACGKITVWKMADGSQVSEEDTKFPNITGMSLGVDGGLKIYKPLPKPGVTYAPWNGWYYNDGFFLRQDQASLKLDFVSEYNPGQACSIPIGGTPVCMDEYRIRGDSWTQILQTRDYILGSDGQIYQADNDFVAKTIELRPGIDGSRSPVLSYKWSGYFLSPDSLDVAHQLFFYSIWSNPNSGITYVMDTGTGAILKQWPDMSIYPNEVVYSPDGKLAAFYMGNIGQARAWLTLFDLENRRVTFTSEGRYYWTKGLSFSPDGKSLAVSMWNPETQKPDFYDVLNTANPAASTRYEFPLIPNARPSFMRYSPDGTLLGMGFSDGTLRLFDPRDGSIIYEWKAHSTEITALDFTQDMKHLATASRDGTIRIWGIWP